MNINVYKAQGPDFIPNWILRDFAPFIAQPLTAVFNASLREGTVPEIWKSAIVIPAPKVHPPKLISSDLRPISLLPVLAKVLESFLADWLSDLLEPTFDPNQFGGLKGRSTAHALTSILHSWCGALDQGGSVRALFVDFSKAFDRVDHNILLAKLKDRQIPHCLIRWLHSYLSCRSQTVRVDNHYSDLLYLTAGMPQGSRLGPLTFLLLIDNLSTQCLTHKYVDDTTLSELLTRGSVVSTMQTSFQQLQQWTDLNNMQINFSKTKEMILGPLAKLSPQPLSCNSGSPPSTVEI